MGCLKVTELLSGYIDGMIDEEDKDFVENHLNECDKCKKEYEILKGIVKSCRGLDEVDLPDDFEMELHKRLESEKHNKKPGWVSFIYKYRAVAAGFLALTVSLGMLGSLGILGRGLQKKSDSTAQNKVMMKADIKSGSKEKAGEALNEKTFTAADTADSEESVSQNTKTQDNAPAARSGGAQQRSAKVKSTEPEVPQDSGGGVQCDVATTSGPVQPDNANTVIMAAKAPIEPSYDMINVNLTDDEYKKYIDKIDIDIKSMEGSLKGKDPLQYVLPNKYRDQFISKLTDEFKIQSMDVKNISLADKYRSLKSEEADIENKLNSNLDITFSESMNTELDKKKAEIKELEDESNTVVIQINKNNKN